jgi:RNA polymerase sigma-70 factor (ECF subfamily)
MITTQQSLIERATRWEDEAWRRLKATYTGLVRGFIRRKAAAAGHHHVDDYVDDVVQDVWIRLLTTSRSNPYDRSRGRFRSFLYTLTLSALNDFFRRERRHVAGRRALPASNTIIQTTADDEAEWEREYRRAVLEAVLDELRTELLASNPIRWESFKRYTLDQEEATRVAEALGITVAAVYQHTSRNVKVIKTLLTQYEESYDD